MTFKPLKDNKPVELWSLTNFVNISNNVSIIEITN